MNSNYISGLVDGDGCFHFSCHIEVKRRNGKEERYPRWRYCFVIHMQEREESMLQAVRDVLGCGKVYLFRKTKMARYSVENIEDLCDKVIPFFDNNTLHAVRGKCFEIWKTCLMTLRKIKERKRFAVGNKINMTSNERDYLISLSEEMKKYLHKKPGRRKINF